MLGRIKVLLALGAAITASLGTVTSASAATTPPVTIVTSMYPCSGGVCSMGLGNVGMDFESDPAATGGPEYTGPESSPYAWTVVSGSLPAGLTLAGGLLYGSPTKAGTSSFTLQAADLADLADTAQQAFSITIGTGNLDRVVITSASYTAKGEQTAIYAVDANVGATLTAYVTSTGQEIGTLHTSGTGTYNNLFDGANGGQDPENVTVTSSLGGSATSAVGLAKNRY